MIKALLFSLSLIASSAYAVIFVQDLSTGTVLIPGDNTPWINMVNTTGTAGKAEQTSGAAGHVSRAVFASLPASTDGELFYQSTAANFNEPTESIGCFTLTATPTVDGSLGDCKYGIYLAYTHDTLYWVDTGGGSDPYSFNYTTSTIFSIERIGTTFYGIIDGSVHHTFSSSSSAELWGYVSTFEVNAGLENIRLEYP